MTKRELLNHLKGFEDDDKILVVINLSTEGYGDGGFVTSPIMEVDEVDETSCGLFIDQPEV